MVGVTVGSRVGLAERVAVGEGKMVGLADGVALPVGVIAELGVGTGFFSNTPAALPGMT